MLLTMACRGDRIHSYRSRLLQKCSMTPSRVTMVTLPVAVQTRRSGSTKTRCGFLLFDLSFARFYYLRMGPDGVSMAAGPLMFGTDRRRSLYLAMLDFSSSSQYQSMAPVCCRRHCSLLTSASMQHTTCIYVQRTCTIIIIASR